ncbi:hypothetical protein SAMN06295912_10984 [Sphingomonas laterariae]|uniref:DUF4412 domain-containing protein n=1 Tax=Edaphosphingomonas laterariae TaxID=861865 RepID=A0A239FK65_9SPHN|nr:hypothetical protein [Sphingomonas laterariae]SNS57205.1 hypothetical protein SAMN06295912_10984 [Sphingomonas laterariae]
MMLRPLLALVALVSFALPAHAGLRAVYGSAEENKTLVVEVADSGDVRIAESGDTSFGLMLGDAFYVVSRQPDGSAMAARIEDIAAAIDQVMPPVFGDALTHDGPARPAARLAMKRRGERTVGGRKGDVWRVEGIGGVAGGTPVEYVMSLDDDLKPIGRALEQFMHAAIIPGAPLMGSAAAEFIEETRAIFALGTPLDVGGRFQLRSIERADLAHERFELPVPPATRDALVAAMQAQLPKK